MKRDAWQQHIRRYLLGAGTAIILLSSSALLVRGQTTRSEPAPTPISSVQSSEVILETPTGKLSGTLVIPAGKAPFPAVLIVAGSGMTDRDGNTVGMSGRSDCLKMIAEGLAAAGVASVRYDKRSVGRSAQARLATNSFETQAEDAAAWVAWMGRDQRFGALGIVGHSEGAFVATIAAQRGGVKAVASLAGAGRPFEDVFAEQIERAVGAGQMSKAAMDSLKGALAELRAGRTVTKRPPKIPDILWKGLFHPRAQEYLISLFRYDPVTEIAKLPAKGVHVLIVQGTTDLMGGRGDPDRLAAAAGAKAVIIEGMNHELKMAPLDLAANDKASEDPRVPLAPELLKHLTTFLTKTLSRGEP